MTRCSILVVESRETPNLLATSSEQTYGILADSKVVVPVLVHFGHSEPPCVRVGTHNFPHLFNIGHHVQPA